MDRNLLRQNIINQGIDKGLKATDIDNILKAQGLKEYNPLLESKNYSNLYNNTARGLKDVSINLATFGGAVIKPGWDIVNAAAQAPSGSKKQAAIEKFRKTIQDENIQKVLKGAAAGGSIGSFIPAIGTFGGALVGGTIGAIGKENLANTLLSTYDTTLDDIKKGNVSWKNVVQGAMRNPVEASLDILPIVGKPLGKSVTKAVNRGVSTDAPIWVQQLLPSKDVRKFNRSLTESIVSTKAKQADFYKGLNDLEQLNKINRTELVKQLRENKSNLVGDELKAAERLKADLIANEKALIKEGWLNADAARDDTIAQYVMANVSKDTNLIHKDIVDIIQGRKLDTIASNMFKDKKLGKRVLELIDKGEDLYDKNKIAYITQHFANTKDPLGLRRAMDYVKDPTDYFKTSRIIGRTPDERLGKVLEDSIQFQLNLRSKGKEGLDVLNDVLNNNIAKSISKEAKTDIAKQFKDVVGKDIAEGRVPNLQKALKASGLEKNIDKIYFKSLENAFRSTPNKGFRKVLNLFKKAVLASPHWVALNRLGNWSNNIMDGVTAKDYIDAVGKYKNIIPKQLKQQTSFNSYINEVAKEGNTTKKANSSLAPAWNKLKRAWDRYEVSDKELGNIGNLTSDLVTGLNDVTANAFFKFESAAELTDRYANFIRQAKLEAERTGKTVEEILKKSDIDRALFNKLNTRVNKALGDYVGRNYSLPQGLYDIVSELVPFYRFYTQTGRTTAHQIGNNPLKFLENVDVPVKVGNQLSQEIIDKYNLDPEKYKGGIPYAEQDGNIRTIGLEPIPIGSVAGQLGDIMMGENMTSMINPAFTTLSNVLTFSKFGRPATTPRLTELKLTNPKEAEKFKPTIGEIASYGLNEALSTLFNPYRVGTREIREATHALGYGMRDKPFIKGSGAETGLQSLYDTNRLRTNPLTYNRQYPSELIGRWFGTQTFSNYPKRNFTSKSRARRSAASANRNKQKVKSLKKDKRNL